MIKSFLFILLMTATVAAQAVNPDKGLLKVKTDESTVAWTGRKVTGQHNGSISIKDGTVSIQDGLLTGGTIIMDMTSITVLDQEGGGKTKLEGHLKSDDFFGVEKYPTSTLVVTKTVSKGEGQYAVTADLTIKGITHPINFDALLKLGSDRATVTADLKIDRTLYDVRYGSGKFFDDLGDKTIDDIFELNVKIVAVDRQNN